VLRLASDVVSDLAPAALHRRSEPREALLPQVRRQNCALGKTWGMKGARPRRHRNLRAPDMVRVVARALSCAMDRTQLGWFYNDIYVDASIRAIAKCTSLSHLSRIFL